MKNKSEIIEESITQMVNLLQEFNFQGCNRVSRDLVTVSKFLDDTDGVFAAEVLAAAFSEIDDLVGCYEVDASRLSETRDEVQKRTAALSHSLIENEKEKIYAQLSGIANAVTDFRISTWYTSKPKT